LDVSLVKKWTNITEGITMNRFDLSGKVAIVTGASTGLGKGMSLGLAEAGADLVLVDYMISTETAEEIKAIGRKAITIIADLMNISPIQSIVDQTIRTFGKVDILVNNAGIIRRTPAIEFSEKDWDDVMAINYNR
jgi:2-deoxy-D-gluconate 3-dehydrogenase